MTTPINNAADLYALMTTVNPTVDLAKSYIQTDNIDMSGYTSVSIARTIGLQPYDFSGIYDGGGYTITIGDVVSTYTGLFDSLAKPAGVGGIVKNVNVIYQNPISLILSTGAVWGGLVAEMAVCSIQNCSVTINDDSSIAINTLNSDIGLICGFMGQNSSITNTRLIINNTTELQGVNGASVGLICGQCDNSTISNCSVTTSSGAFDVIVKTGQSQDSVAGLICGSVNDSFTLLNVPVLENITINLNNNGRIIIDNISAPDPPTPLGAFCGIINVSESRTVYIRQCSVNINNNQTLTGPFSNFFGQKGVNTFTIQCEFNYTTVTNNTSRPLTVNPIPPAGTVVLYTQVMDDGTAPRYFLASGGNYYIPDRFATLVIGSEYIDLDSQTGPAGIRIYNNIDIDVFQPVGTTFTSSVPNYNYSIIVKGVGSMYFGLNYSYFENNNIIVTPEECICEAPVCSTNPQTGISANSRITNIREDKIIRINVDREIMRNSVNYPKFKSYSDYMKYLQAGLKY